MEEKRRPNERLRYERELRGWSQQTVADRVGTTEQVVSRWENGQHKPNRHFQTELCKLFGKSAKELGFMSQESEQRAPQEVIDGEVSSSLSSSPTQDMLETNSESEGNFMDRLRRELMKHGVQIVALAPLFPSPTSEVLLMSFLPAKGLPSFLASEASERLVSPHPSAMNAEAFLHVQQLLETAWGLSNAGELYLAEHILSSFLPRVVQLVPHRQEAASLAAESLRLCGILAAHQQRLQDKLAICLQAVEYARQANHPTILVAQLAELAIAFIYAHQPANALTTYQEALSYCEKVQILPSVRSRIYAAAAPTLAKNGQIKEAYSCIEKAYESFPTQLESEPGTFSADNRLFMVDYYQGLLHLVVDQPKEAYQAFEQAITRPSESQIPERWRLIILNYQGLASISSNQLEHYARCLEEGIANSLILGSRKRLDEAVSIFQQHLPQTWSTAPRVKQIVERFQLERESRRAEELEI